MGKINKVQIFFSNEGMGPGKVVKNLISGLDKLGYEVFLNGEWQNECYHVCLSLHNILYGDKIEDLWIGPNICVLPSDYGFVMSQKYKKYLVNSDWTYNLYKSYLNENKIEIWPVGIDTEKFLNVRNFDKSVDCLIYTKNRSSDDINFVKNKLSSLNQTYIEMSYGSYNDNSFIEAIKKSKYSIIIDNTESQGIAIQEIMSCNLPILVWDYTNWNGISATSVPYWSDECGLKVESSEELSQKINHFIENYNSYNPRNFIIENLTLEKAAQNLINIFNNV